MLLRINSENPDSRHVQQAVDCLRDGGVIIYPTDTVYGIGCDIFKQRAVERICKLKKIDPAKANFSFVCHDLAHLSDYAKQVSNPVFKVMRKALPGPFTFILEASSLVPKLLRNNKKTVGIRIPDNLICRTLVRELGNPIMSTSVHDDDEVIDYTTDPDVIYENFKDQVDIVISGGYGNMQASTVVDCTNDEFNIVRQGLGNLEEFM
jgi:tRNA threonylcarbamoyl adenosine modification protein (Sua5/YciO/YrdC/YwlC family)